MSFWESQGIWKIWRQDPRLLNDLIDLNFYWKDQFQEGFKLCYPKLDG